MNNEIRFVQRTHAAMNGDVGSAMLLATILYGKAETHGGAYRLAVRSTVAAVKRDDHESAEYCAAAARWMLERGWHKEGAPQ